MPNLASILDKPASSAERPPAWPAGNYICAINGMPEKGESAQKKTPFIKYNLKPLSAVEGTVDADDLEAFGGVSVDRAFPGLTFYFTDNSEWRHKEFLEDDLGYELGDESHWQAAQKVVGSQVLVTIRQKPTQDGKGVFSEIASTAPVE